jgi:glycosyltransferase involved in cell wall biosynthesis
LERLIAELKLTGDVALPGFVANPFRFMAKSALFVLSSRWEGSGNALTEAMALGIPVVATDCPSGPAEMLGRGQFGLLAPVGDYLSLAEAMNKTLDRPPAPEQLQAAVSEYSIEVSANHYLRELGFEPARSS